MNAYTMSDPKLLIGNIHDKLNEITGELGDDQRFTI
jgi:hypothetical protein